MTLILVVEDTASERQLIASYLKEGGYEVEEAVNGAEAMTKIGTRKPDLIITDLVMPGMSGLELCRGVKKNPETQNIPIVACTSKDKDLDKMWGMKQGIDLYLTKPFTKDEIVKAIKNLVSN